MKKIVYISLILALCVGCVLDYTPSDYQFDEGELVVEGLITDDTSSFTLTKSVDLIEKLELIYVDDAWVAVECDNGETFPASAEGNGVYKISNGALKKECRYRLTIHYKDQEYQSDFLSPLFTPEIDSISWIKEAQGAPVQICVSSTDTEQQSHYYKWSYREVWEYHATFWANAGYVKDEHGVERFQSFDEFTSNNRYYCWTNNQSKKILIGSTEKLTGYVLYKKPMYEVAPSNERLSVVYYVEVTQNLIRKDNYDYLYNMQKNTEESGGLFTPIPSEMKGNIRNITNPRERVIGYVDVSTSKKKERYIWRDEVYEVYRNNCWASITDIRLQGYDILFKGAETTYAPKRCVDCTGGDPRRKIKPENWPTSHF